MAKGEPTKSASFIKGKAGGVPAFKQQSRFGGQSVFNAKGVKSQYKPLAPRVHQHKGSS